MALATPFNDQLTGDLNERWLSCSEFKDFAGTAPGYVLVKNVASVRAVWEGVSKPRRIPLIVIMT